MLARHDDTPAPDPSRQRSQKGKKDRRVGTVGRRGAVPVRERSEDCPDFIRPTLGVIASLRIRKTGPVYTTNPLPIHPAL